MWGGYDLSPAGSRRRPSSKILCEKFFNQPRELGGNGEQTLQLMLMQTEGKKILLLPAWPKDWNCTFKLHAPYKTIVSGTITDGKVTTLTVVPEERHKDVMIAGGQPLP